MSAKDEFYRYSASQAVERVRSMISSYDTNHDVFIEAHDFKTVSRYPPDTVVSPSERRLEVLVAITKLIAPEWDWDVINNIDMTFTLVAVFTIHDDYFELK